MNLEWRSAMLCIQLESESRTPALANFAHAENLSSLSFLFKELYQIQVEFFFYAFIGVDNVFVFQRKYEYKDPLNIIFLCGSHYDKKSKRDKRNILKEYINHSIPNGCAIILEENFRFASTNRQYLSYDSIFLAGLAQIEQLASLYANKIVIVHESISTAAELGMFAIDPVLAHKIGVLVPDKFSIEEDKISGFIKLAFLKHDAPENKVHIIRYYPDIEVHHFSPHKSEYYSYFHEDKVGKFLASELNAFLMDETKSKTICFSRSRFPNPQYDSSTIGYYISLQNKTITVNVHIDTLKIQLLALLELEPIRRQLRNEREIREHVNFLSKTYKDIIRNTVEMLTGKDTNNFNVKIFLKGTSCSLNQAVGYFLYMLQAAKLISLIQTYDEKPTIRKVQFSTAISEYKQSIGDIVFESGTTEFGRLNT